MKFHRETFFDSVRPDPFPGALTQQQVDGMEGILSEWEGKPELTDIRWLAYMLATTFHETAQKMWPITEYGSQSYLQGKEYWPYIGRGFVQLTWEDNYRRATEKLGLSGTDDLVKYPDRALDLVIATNVMFRGMVEGWFTGKKLSGYFSSSVDDPLNARKIINGNDQDDLIKGYHYDFLDALKAAQETAPPEPEVPEISAEVVNVSITTTPGAVVTVTLNGKEL